MIEVESANEVITERLNRAYDSALLQLFTVFENIRQEYNYPHDEMMHLIRVVCGLGAADQYDEWVENNRDNRKN